MAEKAQMVIVLLTHLGTVDWRALSFLFIPLIYRQSWGRDASTDHTIQAYEYLLNIGQLWQVPDLQILQVQSTR